MARRSTSILDRVAAAAKPEQSRLPVPRSITFHEFMHQHAKVRVGSGYVRYSTAGREPLRMVIAIIDFALGNGADFLPADERAALFGTRFPAHEQQPDACVDVCGGAQFGKTIIGLHLKAYLAAVRGLNTYYALPDDDLVQGIVDGKERPEVIDQIPWLAELVKVGKGLNASGKAADRKGAMLYTDGTVTAMSYMRGINAKVPTTFSADCVIEDEKDDIKEANAKFLEGRMTASALRLHITIGTQRFHGAGQNLNFEEGTQHVGYLTCPECGAQINPEESWPKICRMDLGSENYDPWLTAEGDFIDGAANHRAFSPTAGYYFGCPDCGARLDRTRIDYRARRPERIAARRWSVRVSQLCCSGLPVIMFAQSWQNAVRDADSMKAFCCDRLAIPRSTAQAVTPEVLHRAVSCTPPVVLSLAPAEAGRVRYCGLDTGDRCWFTCRELDPATGRKYTVWAESIAVESARARVPALFKTLGAACLFIDAGSERDLARALCLAVNGIPLHIPGAAQFDLGGRVDLGGCLWNGEAKTWRGLKCAAVEFSGKPGSGLSQAIRLTPGNESLYPVVSCNRDEAIGMVVDELLTADEGLQVLGPDGRLRTEPLWYLPADVPGQAPIVAVLHAHLLSGCRTVRAADGKESHYIDKVPNHLLLASTYARLAEAVGAAEAAGGEFCGAESVAVPETFDPWERRL